MKRLIILALPFVLYSCSKDSTTDNDINNNQTPKLKRVTVFDQLLSSPNDSLFQVNFNYDAIGRCTNIIVDDIINNEQFFITYTYNGNDSLITSSKKGNAFYYVKEYYAYDQSGHLLRDSVEEFDNGTLNPFIKHHYENNNTYVRENTLNATNNPIFYAGIFLTKDSRGNITNEIDTIIATYITPPSFYGIKRHTIAYDNNPNPFYNLFPKRLVNSNQENLYLPDWLFNSIFQKNNIVTESKTDDTNPANNVSVTYTYEYNQQGYPTKISSNNITSGEKMIQVLEYQ